MKRFAALFTELDATTSTTAKVQALQTYLAATPAADAAWAVYYLAGGKPRQVVKTATLRELALRVAGLEAWLFEECYQAVGDLAETIAHVLPAAHDESDAGLAEWVELRLLPLRGLPEGEVAERVQAFWRELNPQGRFLLTKLVGGGFRVGVSRLLVQRALAAHAGLDAKLVAQRMMGYTDGKHQPSAAAFEALLAAADATGRTDNGQPYPFFLAHPLPLANSPQANETLASEVAALQQRLGPPQDWQVEWKYDGIRGQVVKRAGQVWLWSRGEELVTERFPEIVAQSQALPDGTVLDGEIMVWQPAEAALAAPDLGLDSASGPALALASRPAPFALLQQRIGRKTLNKKVLAEAPVMFMAYDLLEQQGRDVRGASQRQRRAWLETTLEGVGMAISPLQQLDTWADYAQLRRQSRERGVEGFMLKQLDATYGTGRSKADGLWWKWKIEPMTVDGVLIYAQAGHGRRASLYTDYTFAVWSRPPRDAAEAQAVVDAIVSRAPVPVAEPGQPQPLLLVAFAKAYAGLTDAEFKQIDAVIRQSTLEKFGPVRSVKPSLVFELGFEGINRSPRHKSGIALRFPRMLRLRADKPLHEAASLDDLTLLLNG